MDYLVSRSQAADMVRKKECMALLRQLASCEARHRAQADAAKSGAEMRSGSRLAYAHDNGLSRCARSIEDLAATTEVCAEILSV